MPKHLSRTEHVAKNATYGLVAQVINTLLQFVSRTIFIYTLGKIYLGVNGLFTNVLLILSFAELGIGSAMVYSMYKPLKMHDEDKLCSLLDLYKKCYRVIGIAVAVIGVCLIPFLRYLIKGDMPDVKDNIVFIYLLFLANTVISYFFVYKQSIIIADQNSHITIAYQQAFNILQVVLQIIVLLVFKNFTLYLVIMIACGFLANVVLAKKAERMYPYIKEHAPKPLPKAEIKDIFKNVKALAVYKFASVVLNGSTNIILSYLFNLAVVGIYFNYMLFIHFFTTFLSKITNAFTASIGNLNTESNPHKQRLVFNQLFLICVWLFGFSGIGLLIMHKDIITLWIGGDYVFEQSVALAIVGHFYINAIGFAAYTYRTTLGLFVQGQIAPAIAAVLNIVLSIIMGKNFGVAGVFWATAITRFCTMGIVDPILVYTKSLKAHPIYYYTMYVKFAVYQIGIFFICWYAVSLVPYNNFWGIIIKCLIITILYNLIMYVLTQHTEEFKGLAKACKSILASKRK